MPEATDPNTVVVHVVEDDESSRIASSRLLRNGGYAVQLYTTAAEFLIDRPNGSGCIVLDLNLPGPSGLDLQERLLSAPREREVFAHLISGQLNKQVGYGLGISERTTKIHRHQVLEKLEADSIADLVRMASDLGSNRLAECVGDQWVRCASLRDVREPSSSPLQPGGLPLRSLR